MHAYRYRMGFYTIMDREPCYRPNHREPTGGGGGIMAVKRRTYADFADFELLN